MLEDLARFVGDDGENGFGAGHGMSFRGKIAAAHAAAVGPEHSTDAGSGQFPPSLLPPYSAMLPAMRTVLATLHSKFIHPSLALPYLAAFCARGCGERESSTCAGALQERAA